MGKIISSDTEKLTYVFDLDGVIYRGMIPQPYAVESVNSLLKKGHNVYYFTNNDNFSMHLVLNNDTSILDSSGIVTTTLLKKRSKFIILPSRHSH